MPSSTRTTKSRVSPGRPGNALGFNLVTVSTSKYARKLQGQEINDDSGDTAERIVRRTGYRITSRDLVSDDAQMLKDRVERFLAGKGDIAVFVGGTGISHDDLTIETIRPYFERELDGFGEILRDRSYEIIGSAAFLTRTTAGVAKGKLIICLPGSPDAVGMGLRMFAREFPSILKTVRG